MECRNDELLCTVRSYFKQIYDWSLSSSYRVSNILELPLRLESQISMLLLTLLACSTEEQKGLQLNHPQHREGALNQFSVLFNKPKHHSFSRFVRHVVVIDKHKPAISMSEFWVSVGDLGVYSRATRNNRGLFETSECK
ncbi:hypothetical protein Bca101_067535 [Brassica carinata]